SVCLPCSDRINLLKALPNAPVGYCYRFVAGTSLACLTFCHHRGRVRYIQNHPGIRHRGWKRANDGAGWGKTSGITELIRSFAGKVLALNIESASSTRADNQVLVITCQAIKTPPSSSEVLHTRSF